MLSPLAHLKASIGSMPPAARRVAAFIVGKPETVIHMSVAELAKTVAVSEGSIIGLCQQLGAKGFSDLKIALAREMGASKALLHEDIAREDDAARVIAKIAHSHRMAIDDTLKVLSAANLEQAVRLIVSAKRVEIYGIGTSAPIAEDAASRLMRLGLDARAVVDSHAQAISAAHCSGDVATITISHSGRTVETLLATRLAKEAGAHTICITNLGKPPLLKYCDVALFTAAVETRYRMEAMASRVAQLVVIDALYGCIALASWDKALGSIEKSYAILTHKRVGDSSD